MKPLALSGLFALPIQSAVRAQALALQEMMAVLESTGVENGQAKMFRLRAERVVEERTVDPATGSSAMTSKVEPFELSIPLLALVPVSAVQIQSLDVDFAIEVTRLVVEPVPSPAAPTSAVSLSQSMAVFAPLGRTDATHKIHMRLGKEVPEGLARVGDLLNDLLGGQAARSLRPDDLPGLTAEHVRVLRTRRIFTISDFMATTSARSRIAELAEALGVPASQIDAWRKDARRLDAGT